MFYFWYFQINLCKMILSYYVKLLIILYNKEIQHVHYRLTSSFVSYQTNKFLFLSWTHISDHFDAFTSQENAKKYFHPEKTQRICTNLRFFSIACKYHYTKPIRSILRIIQHRDRLFNYDMYTVRWGRVHIWSGCNHRIYRSI